MTQTDLSDGGAMIAAFTGSMDFIVPFIREYGSSCYANSQRDTLLHAAADGWQYRMVEYLLITGAEPNAQNKDGDTPLHMVTRQITIPFQGKFIFDTPSVSARSKTFSELILRGADRNSRNSQGATPLHLAASNGDIDALTLLVDAPSIDTRTARGSTALLLAVLNGHAVCARHLIQFGANIEIDLPDGRRVSDYVQSSYDPNIRALLELPAVSFPSQ